MTFANHGCNGTHNLGGSKDEDETELTIDLANISTEIEQDLLNLHEYNPMIARNLPHLWGGVEVALRDIQAGEEILSNYVSFGCSEAKRCVSQIEELQRICRGEGVGYVTKLEERK